MYDCACLCFFIQSIQLPLELLFLIPSNSFVEIFAFYIKRFFTKLMHRNIINQIFTHGFCDSNRFDVVGVLIIILIKSSLQLFFV